MRGDSHNEELTKRVEAHFTSKRYNFTKRHYTAQEVANLMPSLDVISPAHYLSQKMYKLLRNNFDKRESLSCYGALDNVQMINSTKYQPCIYVSGW